MTPLHFAYAFLIEQIELNAEISESKHIIKQENESRRKIHERKRAQQNTLEKLGLDEAGAVEYLLMLSRDEALQTYNSGVNVGSSLNAMGRGHFDGVSIEQRRQEQTGGTFTAQTSESGRLSENKDEDSDHDQQAYVDQDRQWKTKKRTNGESPKMSPSISGSSSSSSDPFSRDSTTPEQNQIDWDADGWRDWVAPRLTMHRTSSFAASDDSNHFASRRSARQRGATEEEDTDADLEFGLRLSPAEVRSPVTTSGQSTSQMVEIDDNCPGISTPSSPHFLGVPSTASASSQNRSTANNSEKVDGSRKTDADSETKPMILVSTGLPLKEAESPKDSLTTSTHGEESAQRLPGLLEDPANPTPSQAKQLSLSAKGSLSTPLQPSPTEASSSRTSSKPVLLSVWGTVRTPSSSVPSSSPPSPFSFSTEGSSPVRRGPGSGAWNGTNSAVRQNLDAWQNRSVSAPAAPSTNARLGAGIPTHGNQARAGTRVRPSDLAALATTSPRVASIPSSSSPSFASAAAAAITSTASPSSPPNSLTTRERNNTGSPQRNQLGDPSWNRASPLIHSQATGVRTANWNEAFAGARGNNELDEDLRFALQLSLAEARSRGEDV